MEDDREEWKNLYKRGWHVYGGEPYTYKEIQAIPKHQLRKRFLAERKKWWDMVQLNNSPETLFPSISEEKAYEIRYLQIGLWWIHGIFEHPTRRRYFNLDEYRNRLIDIMQTEEFWVHGPYFYEDL